MHRVGLVGFLLLFPAIAQAQEPPPQSRVAVGLTCDWTDHPIVPGATPLRAAHIMEIRACLSAILERVNGGGGGGGPACEEDWQRSGTGEDIFAVPQCVNRVHLRVDPGGTAFRLLVLEARPSWSRLGNPARCGTCVDRGMLAREHLPLRGALPDR